MIEEVAMRRALRRRVIVAALKCRNARQPVADVEGVGDLAELAVADAVDTGRDLLFDDLVDSKGKTSIEGRLLERSAGFARLEKLQQLGRPRQAADMGRQNAVGAVL